MSEVGARCARCGKSIPEGSWAWAYQWPSGDWDYYCSTGCLLEYLHGVGIVKEYAWTPAKEVPAP